jgi:hypothetical protein
LDNEFWMPAPHNGPPERHSAGPARLTPEEQAVLRRLLRGERTRKYVRLQSPRRQRALQRQRRKLLDRLGSRDLRSLVQIVMELGL